MLRTVQSFLGDTGERMQKVKEVRVRIEEERMKKLREIEQQFILSKRHREQLDEERKRKIEEARVREAERRIQVEERKRQIWEAEQERKEAILRRNMEREARIEARRNAQRNSQCFAFGSSTPRTFDFDLAAIGSQGPVLMSSVSNRRSEEREPSRATSACSLDRKFETKPPTRDVLTNSPAVLDQNYLYKKIALRHKSSNDMKACLSMLDPHPPFLLEGSGYLVGGEDLMSRSMISLSTFRGRKRTDITPTLSRERSITPHLSTRGKQSMRAVSMTRLDQLAQPRQSHYRHPVSTIPVNKASSRSMCNLAAKKPPSLQQPPDIKCNMRPAQSMMHLAPPRLTRTAKLRAIASKSAWNLNNPSPGKDASRSPTRPQSSMSGASDISATSSSVSLRAHSAYRRPRPISVAGSIADSSVHLMVKKDFERQSLDKNASGNMKVNREEVKKKKPIPPPKSSTVLARAKSHPPPTKDNLRKAQKPSGTKMDDTQQHLSKNVSQSRKSIEVELKVKNTLSDMSVSSPNIKETIKDDSEILNQLHVSARNDSVEISSQTTKETQIINQSSYQTEKETQITNQSSLQTAKETQIANQSSSQIEKETQITNQSSSQVEKETQISNQSTSNEMNLKSRETPLSTMENKTQMENSTSKDTKVRITSEEEARIALAEKRRLAREQAEKEAELERIRLEELKRQEEERIRLEEAEQKRVEEEQIRLAAIHRQFEEEKLRKAIEEQQQREMEEQRRKEEEMRQKAEREELERKAREEAEKQRIELEEKLRKEEEERAERKKRVEQIMARTRNKMASNETSKPKESQSSDLSSKKDPIPDLLNNTESITTNGRRTTYEEDSANNHSNGYHEDMSCTTSPEEEKSDADKLLIDIQSSCELLRSSSEFTKLVDLQQPHHLDNNSVNNDNFLINVDDFNSNIVEDTSSLQRNSSSAIPDLLS
nr:MAP7 domain-containing protein 3 isoform X2 [Parasteatoda tepidariorum]